MLQKVDVYLDEKGIPAPDDIVTQSVLKAVCTNFNILMERGLVLVRFDYTEPEPMDIFEDERLIYSMAKPIRPTIRLIPQPNGNRAVFQVLMPQ